MIVKFCVAGWNGYGQWNTKCKLLPEVIDYFEEISAEEYLDSSDVKYFDLNVEWAYNIIVVNSDAVIKGFHDEGINKTVKLEPPNSARISHCSANDKYALFYNINNHQVWKYLMDGDVKDRWKMVPNFIEVEKKVEGEEQDDEDIVKLVSSIRMNIALSSKGNLYSIPNKIDTTKILGKIIDVQCGHEHAILLTDKGNVYTWGGGSRCQLGHGNTTDCEQPQLVEALSGVKITQIAAGGWHCCAISMFQDLYSWGWNERGQLGIYVELGTEDFKQLSKEQDKHQETKTRSKRQKLSEGRFENKALPNYALPTLIDLYDGVQVVESNIVEVACGSKHTIIKLEDETIWGTGCNKHSQLGIDNKKTEFLNLFTKLDVQGNCDSIKCGLWSTVLIYNDD